MANIRTFYIDHMPTYGEIMVEIDMDYPNLMDRIKEMVEFWMGWEQRLEENKGDYLNTFLKQLCRKVIVMAVYNNLNEYGVIEEMKGDEGWCAMDGSNGIKILYVSHPDFSDERDYNIESAKMIKP